MCRPAELAEQVGLDFHEEELVKQLLTVYEAKGVCRGAKCACKKKKSAGAT